MATAVRLSNISPIDPEIGRAKVFDPTKKSLQPVASSGIERNPKDELFKGPFAPSFFKGSNRKTKSRKHRKRLTKKRVHLRRHMSKV